MNDPKSSLHWSLRLGIGLAFGLAALLTAFAAVAEPAGDAGADAAGYAQAPSTGARRVGAAPVQGTTLQRPTRGGIAGGPQGGGGQEGVPGGGPGGYETPGGGRDYALLKQTHDPRAPSIWGYVLLELDVDKGEILDEPWDPSWEYESGTTDNELRHQLSLEWYGQASCAAGIQSMSVHGPGGTETQSLSPGQNTVHGKFGYQSFTLATIKKICVDWAEQTPPGWPMAPMPAQYEDFDLVGGLPPTTAADQLTLNWRCIGGAPQSSTYQPKIRLRCSRQGS